MSGVARVRVAAVDTGASLFDRIGAFLTRNGLSPDPAHYAFAHHVVADPDSALALAVADITDGGVRLSRRDIEALGGTVVIGKADQVAPALPAVDDASSDLAARVSDQVESFATIVQAMREETSGFGRDLARSAEAIGRMPANEALGDIARITGAMLERVQHAERRLATAIEEAGDLREKLAEARETARRDPLTALPNRRAFEEAFAGKSGDRHCMAVFDIDRFKRVNDAFGHAVGDRVLLAIGATLADTLAGHLVARHGGEEFAVLMTGVDLAEAATLLDRARAAVAAKRFRARDTGQPLGSITISAGVTAVRTGEDVETSFSRADRLLYAAKASGRDAVLAD